MNHLSYLAIFAPASIVTALLATSLIARCGFPIVTMPGRYQAIDGLRGFLAVSVLIHHFTIWLPLGTEGWAWVAPKSNILNQLGSASLGLFFVITGFVFSPRIRAGLFKNDWVSIYIKRVFRLQPLIIFSAFCIFAITVLRTGQSPLNVQIHRLLLWATAIDDPDLLGQANTARTNAGVIWTLTIEWVFYILIMPGCAFGFTLLRKLHPDILVPAGLFAASAAGALFNPFIGLACLFAIGMAVNVIVEREDFRMMLHSRPATVVAIVSLILLYFGFHETVKRVSLPVLAAQTVLIGYFFSCIASGNTIFGLLSSRASRVLGEISFSIYLLHGIVLSLLFEDFGLASLSTISRVAMLPAIVCIVVLIATATYLLIERPANILGGQLARSWAHRNRGRSAPIETELAP